MARSGFAWLALISLGHYYVVVDSPLILALDTTQEHGSIALYRGEEALECHEITAPQSFSQVIFSEIQRVLAAHAAGLPDVELYAVAAGPGSFTGVRVALTAAKALAKVHGKLMVPVSNLAALALLAWRSIPAAPRVLVPVLDARRREVYAGVYDRSGDNGRIRTAEEDAVLTPLRLEERLRELGLPQDQTAYCGPDLEKFELNAFPRLVTGRAIAGALAEFALGAWLAGEAQPPDDVDANYVRRSDAEIFSKPSG